MNGRKSKILHFDGLLFSKSYKVSAKKVQKSHFSWYRKVICITFQYHEKWLFKEKLTFGFEYGMWNLVNFHPTTKKSENFTSMGSFCPKYIMFQLKNFRGIMWGVIFYDTEQWCKIWINPNLVVSKLARGIGLGELLLEHSRVWKNVHWWDLFVQSI